jgi:multiple sugar transport system permease protein
VTATVSSPATVTAADRTGSDKRHRRPLRKSAPFYLAMLVLGFIFVAPLVYMVLTSFKTANEATSAGLNWFPKQWSLHGYDALTQTSAETPVLHWFLNSMIAAVCNAALVVSTAALAAYALARMEFPGKRLIFGVIVSTLFIPPVVLLIPNYLIVDQLGWLNTLLVVIVPGAAGAFSVFFLRQFYMGMPKELEEAALVDGANRYQIFLLVILPLARTALATLAVLTFLTNWNDFLWPIYVLFSPQNLTLQPGLAALQGAATVHYPVIMAGGVLTSIPVLILFIVAQRHIVQGIASSGLTGR